MVKKPDTKNIDMLIMALILAIIGVMAITVPISDTKDVYVDMTVSQPLYSITELVKPSVEFTAVKANAIPHTLLTAPISPADLLTSGKIRIEATTGSKKATKIIDAIWRGTSVDTRVIISDVPVGENKVTLELYDNEKLSQTYEVTLS